MSRQFGITPRTADEIGQHLQAGGQSVVPVPLGPGQPPYRLELSSVLTAAADGTKPLTVATFGDSGGVKDPNPQAKVAAVLAGDTALQAVYHLGDIDYFEGADAEYGPQFFEPYAKVNVPFLGIPGNHDCEGGNFDSFVKYFCASSVTLPPEWEEYGRTTMDQPNPYWTLRAAQVTVVGLATNAPSGGEVDSAQAEWLAEELKAAPEGVPLVVALHHPPYSVDDHHGGSARMGTVIDTAAAAAGRWPDLVLSGHVHDYQRFTRTVDGREIVYVVAGAGGYHNLHSFASGAEKGLQVTNDTVFEFGEDKDWGYLRLTFPPAGEFGKGKQGIAGSYVTVGRGTVDTFTVGA